LNGTYPLNFVSHHRGAVQNARSGDPVIGGDLVIETPKPRKPTPNRTPMRQIYANLGCLGMTTAQTYANLGWVWEGEGTASGDRVIGKPKSLRVRGFG
jgi:hypothetical protein